MIHPMWSTFMVAMFPSVHANANRTQGMTDDQFYAGVAMIAGKYADAACAEYDKRDKASNGSPYRS